eukprot:scaffold11319_cov78-Cylindrotheca_fusiformis.AAC.1
MKKAVQPPPGNRDIRSFLVALPPHGWPTSRPAPWITHYLLVYLLVYPDPPDMVVLTASGAYAPLWSLNLVTDFGGDNDTLNIRFLLLLLSSHKKNSGNVLALFMLT